MDLRATAILCTLCAALGFGGGFSLQGLRWTADVAQIERDHARTLQTLSDTATRALQAETAKRQTVETRFATADTHHFEELTRAQTENDLLRATPALAGQLRIHALIPACGDQLPATAPGAGVDTGRAVELPSTTRSAVLDLRAALLRDRAQLTACQALLRIERDVD